MDIIVSARHFDLSEALKVQAENAAHAALDDLTLKISSVRVVLDIQKNVHKADVVVAIKNNLVRRFPHCPKYRPFCARFKSELNIFPKIFFSHFFATDLKFCRSGVY